MEQSEPGEAEFDSSPERLDGAAAPMAAGEQDAGGAQDAGGGMSRPGTGDLRVDAALEPLDRLPEVPVSDHPELFERVHAQLTEVLGELDSGLPGPGESQGG